MVKIVNAIMNEDEIAQINSARNEVRIRSNLSCFSVTNGIRPAEFSVIVGKAGNGKSALCKTALYEATISGINSLTILSEETSGVYKETLTRAFKSVTQRNVNQFLERMFFDSMLDWTPQEKNFNFFFAHLEKTINEKEIDLVIFDNFTTSFFGGLSIAKQGEAVDNFRKLASIYDIAIVGVFHTTKGANLYEKVLDGEDVRGNATTTNAGSYNYILSTFFRANPPRAILNLDKARYHTEANKTFWELHFDKELELYTHAKKIDYETVKLIMHDINEKSKDKIKNITGKKPW